MTIRDRLVFAARWCWSWAADAAWWTAHGIRAWWLDLDARDTAQVAAAKARHPARVPGRPRDGEPLSAEEARVLGRISMDCLIRIPEVFYRQRRLAAASNQTGETGWQTRPEFSGPRRRGTRQQDATASRPGATTATR